MPGKGICMLSVFYKILFHLYNRLMSDTTIFFDLDGTLYPGDNGLWEAIRDRMNLYIKQRFGLPDKEVTELRHRYYGKYGTTLRGLQIHYQVDAEDYLSFVHDLPLQDYIQPSPYLRAMLLSLSHPCWIFTNADAHHAGRVLDILGVTDCFSGVIDVRAIDFACKPEVIAYQRALSIAGDPPVEQCVFLDDSVENLGTAHQMGFTTVLIGGEGDHSPVVDHSLERLLNLPKVIPELWD